MIGISQSVFSQSDSSSIKNADEYVHPVPEVYAEYPGGTKALYDYISSNLNYPKTAYANGVEGKVYIKLAVLKDGSISEVQVIRGIGSGCDEECARIVKSMPKWIPGSIKGEKVNSYFTLPIVFKLD